MALLDALTDLFINNGYIALFTVLVVCGLGVPIPEDISLVAGGIIAGLGHAELRTMIVVGLAGVLVGDSIMFLVGYRPGPHARRLRWVARVLTPRRYARVQAKFDRYGNRMLFFARFLPGLRTEGGREWMGLRPSLPDSLPVIGQASRAPRVFYAFGHGHLGLTQAAATGRLVRDLVAGRPAVIDLSPFSPSRF